MKPELFALARAVGRWCLPRPLVRRLQRSGWYLRRHYFGTLASFDPSEEPDLRVVCALVQPGELAIDVGANIGVYTRFLSRAVGATGQVWSLEPVPFTYSVLAHNVRAMGLANVTPLRVAATEADGPIRMAVPHADSGHLNIYLAHVEAPTGEDDITTVSTEGRSLDSLLSERGGAPAFVKIDVEGHEAACIKGATHLLATHRPALLIELSSDPDLMDSDAHRVVTFLETLSYGCYWWNGAALRRRSPGEAHVNHFFLQRVHLERLRSVGLGCAD